MFKKHSCFLLVFILSVLFFVSCAAKHHDHSIEIYFGIDGDVYTDERKALEKGHYTLKYVREDDTLADVLARVSASTNMEPSSWDGSAWKRSNYGDYGFTAVDGNSNTRYIYNFDWNDTKIKFRRNNPFSYQVIGLDDQIGDVTALYPDYTKQELIEVPIYHAFYDSSVGKTSKFISAQEINANFLRTVYRLPAESTIPTDIWSVSTVSGSDDWFSNTAVTNYLRTSKSVSKLDYGYIDLGGRYLSFNPSYNDYMSGHCMYYLITALDDNGEPRFKTEDGSTDRVVISSDNINYIVGNNRGEGHLTFKKDPNDPDDEGEYVGLYPVYKELKETVHIQYYNRVGSADNRITDSYEVNVGNPFLTPTQLRNQQAFSWNPLKDAEDDNGIDYGYQGTGGGKFSYTQSEITLADGSTKKGWLFCVCDSNFNETNQTIFASTDGGDIVTHEYYLKPYYDPEDAIVIHIAYYSKDGSEEKRTTIELPKTGAYMPSPSNVEGIKDIYDEKLKYGYVTSDGRHKKIFDAVDGKYAYTYVKDGITYTIYASSSTNPLTAASEADALDDRHNGITFRPVYVDDTIKLNIVIKATRAGSSPSDVTLSLTLKSGDTLEDLKGRLLDDLSSYKYDVDSPVWNKDSTTGDYGYVDENGYYYSFSLIDNIEDIENVFVFKDSDGNTLTSKDEITTDMVIYPQYSEPKVKVIIHYYTTGEGSPAHHTFVKEVRKGATLSDISSWMPELREQYLSIQKYDGTKFVTGLDRDENCKLYTINGSAITVTDDANEGYGDEYFKTELQCGYRDYSRYGRRFYFDFNEDSKFIIYNDDPSICTEFNRFNRVVEDIDLYPQYVNAGYAPIRSKNDFGGAGYINTVFVPFGTSPYPRAMPYTLPEVRSFLGSNEFIGNNNIGQHYLRGMVKEAAVRTYRTSVLKRAGETEIPLGNVGHSLEPIDTVCVENTKTNYFNLLGGNTSEYILPSQGDRIGNSTYGLKVSEIPLTQEFIVKLLWNNPTEVSNNVRIWDGFDIVPIGMNSPRTPAPIYSDTSIGFFRWSNPEYYDINIAFNNNALISYKTETNNELFSRDKKKTTEADSIDSNSNDYEFQTGVHDIYPWTGAGADEVTIAALCNLLTYIEDGGLGDCVYYFDSAFKIPVTTANRYTITKNAVEQFSNNVNKYFFYDFANLVDVSSVDNTNALWGQLSKSILLQQEIEREKNITRAQRRNASYLHINPTDDDADNYYMSHWNEERQKQNTKFTKLGKANHFYVNGGYIQQQFGPDGTDLLNYRPRIYIDYSKTGYRAPTVLEAEYMKRIVLNELQIPNEDEDGKKIYCNTLEFPDMGGFHLFKLFEYGKPDAFERGKIKVNDSSFIVKDLKKSISKNNERRDPEDSETLVSEDIFFDAWGRPTDIFFQGAGDLDFYIFDDPSLEDLSDTTYDMLHFGLKSYNTELLGYDSSGGSRCIDGYDLVEPIPNVYGYYFQSNGTLNSGHSLKYYGDTTDHPEYRTFYDSYTNGFKMRDSMQFVLATEYLKKNLNRRNGANIFDMNFLTKTNDTGYTPSFDPSEICNTTLLATDPFAVYKPFDPFAAAKGAFSNKYELVEMGTKTYTNTMSGYSNLYYAYGGAYGNSNQPYPGKGETDWGLFDRNNTHNDVFSRNSVSSALVNNVTKLQAESENRGIVTLFVCREVKITDSDYQRLDNKWNMGGTGPAK